MATSVYLTIPVRDTKYCHEITTVISQLQSAAGLDTIDISGVRVQCSCCP